MMEFTLSRVTLTVCGMIMLAAVLAPVNSVFEKRTDLRMQEQTDNVAAMLDRFYESQADEMVLDLGSVLPTASCSISMHGNVLKVNDNGNEYVSCTKHPVIPDSEHYGCNDMVRFAKIDGAITVGRLM